MSMRKPSVPMKPILVAPNMNAEPISQKQTEPITKSITFFIMMLLVFLARVKPASTRANPACITNTRMPAISVQTTFRLT